MMLPIRKLGSTDIEVSLIGLGTVKLGRNTDVKYPDPFIIPNDREAANLLALAKDLNINLLDTAPAYGNSEERLGKLLRKQRHAWVLASKAGEDYVDNKSVYDFTPNALIKSIQRSLKCLNTDYLDVLLIHSDGNDEQIIQEYDVFATLDRAKQQGLIRAYGMSTKTVAGGLLAVQQADLAMVTYNPEHPNDFEVLQSAAKLNKGILIKKAFASGHLPAPTSLEFVLQQPAISSIIVGTINSQHLIANVDSVIEILSSST